MAEQQRTDGLRPEQLFRLETLRRELDACHDLDALRQAAFEAMRLVELTRNAWEQLHG